MAEFQELQSWTPASGSAVRATAPVSDIRAQLERILASEPFLRSERLSRFLRFTVEQVLENDDPVLKEYVIAVEVFDKPKSFDPRLDPIVRVEARRLRTRLREYYEAEGRADPIHIRIARRGYSPEFLRQPGASDSPVAIAAAAFGPVPIAAPSVRAEEPSNGSGKPVRPVALAVLPFLDLSPKGDQQYFCAGFTEELINAIAQSPGLRVASRTSSSQYEGKAADIRQVGRELGVAFVLEGSIRTNAERMRIAAQLSDVADGFELWSQTYERQVEDIFTVQAEIAGTIAEGLKAQLANRFAEPPAAGRPEIAAQTANNARAYRLYLRGLQYWRKAESTDPQKSIYHFERAIDEDPRFAAAYAGLAHSYAFLAWFNEMRPAEAWTKAEAAARSAVELDPSQSAVLAVVGCARALFNWDWPAAEREFHRAIDLNPADAGPHQWYAVAYLSPLRRLDEALREIEVAQKLEPLSPLIQCQAGLIHLYRGEYSEAAELCNTALDIEPAFWPALWYLGRVLMHMGRLDEAETVLLRAQQASANLPAMAGYLADCNARQGKRDRALAIAARLRRLARSRYVSPLHLVRIHAAFGELDSAFELLESARLHRCCRMVELFSDPAYAPLRSDPRFARILRAIGLPHPPSEFRHTA